MMTKKDLELYIHIPFCVRKCAYCDFLSGPADAGARAAYVDALIGEIKLRGEYYRDYCGGGGHRPDFSCSSACIHDG